MPGTISLFSEAYAELIGSGETGLDAQARFYKDIATGTIKSAEILPIFARLASERAAPKIGIMKKTSIAEQGRFRNELSDLLMVASESGVEKGMADFFKTLASGVRGAQPLIRGLSGAFQDLTKIMRPFGDLFTDFNRGLESISQVTGVAEKNIVALIGLGAALTTKWGRVAAAFTAVAIVLQDISWGVQGRGESVTGDFFKLMDDKGLGLGEFEKALFGVSSALLAIALGLKAIGYAAKMAGLGGLLPTGDDKDSKKGKDNKKGSPRKGLKAGGLLGLALGAVEVLSGDTDDPNFKVGLYKDSDGNWALGLPKHEDRFNNPLGDAFYRTSFDDYVKMDRPPESSYTPIPGIGAPMNIDSKVDLSIKVEVGSLEEMQRYLEVEFPEVIIGTFEDTLPQFNQKE